MRAAGALLAALAAAGASASPDSADLRRVYRRRPGRDDVTGPTAGEAWRSINAHLRRGPAPTRPCEEWTHAELNDAARGLLARRHDAFNKIYKNRNDKRALHFDSVDYKERVWAGEGAAPSNVTRDGKCAEQVLWYTHHLNVKDRQALAAQPGFRLPLLPAGGPQVSEDKEYIFAVQCSTCHLKDPTIPAGDLPPDPPAEKLPLTCPIDNTTGKPHNWYNRTKRCDWDFDPPCEMCQSLGGYIWGDGEDEIHFGECEPVMKPEDIPEGNMTSPVFPEAFTVKAYNVQIDQTDLGGPFPGGDPCDTTHHFEIQYQLFEYDGRDNKNVNLKFTQNTTYGPPAYGTEGGHNTTAYVWHYPDTNMWVETLKPDMSMLFCMCVGVHNNGNHSIPGTLGPIRHDFADKAVLIGRERVGIEGYAGAIVRRNVLCDHWYLGPHHFWVEVATNLVVRGWQPWNSLQTFFDWEIMVPDAKKWELSSECKAQYNNQSCPHGGWGSPGELPPVPSSKWVEQLWE